MKKLLSIIAIVGSLFGGAFAAQAQDAGDLLKLPEGLNTTETVAVAMCIAFMENDGAARVIGETADGWTNLGSKSPVPSLYGILEYEHEASGLAVYATRENFDLRETRYCGIIQFDPPAPLNLDALNGMGMTAGKMEANDNGEIRTWSLEDGDVKYMVLAGVQADSNEINFFKHSN